MRSVRLCAVEELPDGESRGFDPLRTGRDTLFVVRRAGRVRAWRDACPHIDGAPMAWRKDAYLNADRDRIVCGAHGAQFDIETGVCVVGPCLGRGLEPVEITSMNGALYVDLWRAVDQPRGEHE
jgi:nitrite reductase/ring-hydroxylating ferredoxin subunit